VFYDAQAPASVIARMAKFFPRFDYGLLTRSYGPLLWRLFRLWSPRTFITDIKVGSHLASIPNGNADLWTTLTLDFITGSSPTHPPPGPPVTAEELTIRARTVWPLTFLGVATKLRAITTGTLVAHCIAATRQPATPRFPLTMRDLSVERFHHKVRAGQIWSAMTAVRVAVRTGDRRARQRDIPPIPVALILNAPECICGYGCRSRVDSAAHIIECINSAPLMGLRRALQNSLLPVRIPEPEAARLGFHPAAVQHILGGYIPLLWEPLLGSGCQSTTLHTQVLTAYRTFVSAMSDRDDPVVQNRRERCQQLLQPDFTALRAQDYLPVSEGGKGQPLPDPAPVDTPPGTCTAELTHQSRKIIMSESEDCSYSSAY
jgi:hypothetical protein